MGDAKPGQGAFQLHSGQATGAFSGFGCEKYTLAMGFQPRRQTKLGVAVARRGIDMVDAVLVYQFQHLVRFVLAHAAQCRGAKDNSSGMVPGVAEFEGLDGGCGHALCLQLPLTTGGYLGPDWLSP